MRKDWQKRLSDVLTLYTGAPFVWGATDCVCFASDVAVALTGEDPRQWYHWDYSDRRSAVQQVRARGFKSFRAALQDGLALCGWTPRHDAFEHAGDIGFTDAGVTCVRLPSGWVSRDRSGTFRVVPRSAVVSVWSARRG